ncbi:hypothetical protein AGMMS50229_15210 [Campylobacterota bacterium]|nr:hypothetical protein AGMMS50229_15210 [Campylobacterota bacterium]
METSSIEKNAQDRSKSEEARAKLESCQHERGYKSCYPCDRLFECEARIAFVNTIYASMSLEQSSGGFQF